MKKYGRGKERKARTVVEGDVAGLEEDHVDHQGEVRRVERHVAVAEERKLQEVLVKHRYVAWSQRSRKVNLSAGG